MPIAPSIHLAERHTAANNMMDISAMVSPSVGGCTLLAITILASFVGAEDEHIISASKPIIDKKKSHARSSSNPIACD